MKKVSRILAAMLAIVLVFGMLTACGAPGAENSQPPASNESQAPEVSDDLPLNEDGSLIEGYNYGFHFAYVVSYTPAEFFQSTYVSFKAELEKYGCTLDLLGDATYGSEEAEIKIIENAIASQKYDAMIVYPANIEALRPICKEASKQGVPVIAFGVDAEYDMGDVHFNFDNFEMGGLIAEMAIEWVYAHPEHFGDEVEICIQRNFSNSELEKRGAGSIARIEEENAKGGTQFKIVLEKDAGSYEDGMALAENLHVAFPNCEIIIGTDDDPMVGAAEAWEAMGKDITYCGTFGNNCVPLALAAMADPNNCFRGSVNQSVDAQPPIVAFGLIKLALGVLKEGEMPVAPLFKVTQENMGDYYNIADYYTGG